MTELTIDENKTDLAFVLNHLHERLSHHGVRHVRDRAAARQPMLVLRAGAHLALENKFITSQQVEGALDILSRDTIEPKSRDELCAFSLKMSEIGFSYIPAYQFWRIEKPGLLANSFEGCQEFVHPVPIVPIIAASKDAQSASSSSQEISMSVMPCAANAGTSAFIM